jgi:hypothetical protein
VVEVDIDRGFALGPATLGAIQSTAGLPAFDLRRVLLHEVGEQLPVLRLVLMNGTTMSVALGDFGHATVFNLGGPMFLEGMRHFLPPVGLG